MHFPFFLPIKFALLELFCLIKIMWIRTLILCATLTGMVTLTTACSDQKKANRNSTIVVRTQQVQPQEAYRWIDTFGQTEGAQEVEVRAQVSGIMRKLNFREGEAVKAGQTLFEIEKEPYEAALRQARAQTQQAQTTLNKAQRDAKRAQALIKVNAISRQEFDDFISALESAKSALAVAQAAQQKAEIDLSHANVPASVDGVAGKSEVNVGSLVSSGTTLLTTITQPSDLRVTFAISDKDLSTAELSKKNKVLVFAPAAKTPIEAQLDFIGQQVDADRGTIRMRAKLPQGTRLWPGQYVEVRMMVGTIENAFVVPQGVVRQKPDGTYAVYIYQDGMAREREVFVSHWEGKNWVLTGGLSQGDKVIVNQILRLRDKTPVKLENAPQAEGLGSVSKQQH